MNRRDWEDDGYIATRGQPFPSGLIVSLAAGRAAGFPVRYLFTRGRRTFKIEVQPIIRFSSGKSKSICAEWSGKVPRLCAIWTPQCGGDEGESCVFIKCKSKNLVSNCRIFHEKNISFFENRERSNKNLWTFLRNTPFFSLLPPRFFGKDARSFAHHFAHCFLIRTAVRANGHAPAHRALSEFEILAFTLHLHPQFVDTVCVAGEGKGLFPPSPGEGNRGETFTRKSLFPRCLQSYGEEVKAKTKTADARATRARWG